MPRSASGSTVVSAVEVLLAGAGSGVVAVTVAVFDSVAAWTGAVTTTVMVAAVPPDVSKGSVQVADTFPAFEQLHPDPVADTNVTPAGSVSVTDRPAASAGPAFATDSW